MTRRTKIVATLGPASDSPELIARLVGAGMDVARLNTSHGEIDRHVLIAGRVREAAEAAGRPVGVLMDLGGPKLRSGMVEGGGTVRFATGERAVVVDGAEPTVPGQLSVAYPHLRDVRPGHRVLVDDGAIEFLVEETTASSLVCRVVQGGAVGSRKGVSFPDSKLTLRSLTARDREAITAGVAAGVDFFALSFVADAADLRLAKTLIRAAGGATPVIAKIERRLAVDALDEIAAEADGLMVARGDLGVDLPPEEVPVQQRRIIAAGSRRMIPVITATQMLESMIVSPRPTRAESSDVAHAVWDLTDAVMLSGETAAGAFPVAALEMMARIIGRAEATAGPATGPVEPPAADDHSWVVAQAVRRIVEADRAMRGVACFTKSGSTALLLSKARPPVPIFALTPSPAVARRLTLAGGVQPMVVPFVETSDEMLRMVDERLQATGVAVAGEEVVVVASLPVHVKGPTNFLKLHRVGEAARY